MITALPAWTLEYEVATLPRGGLALRCSVFEDGREIGGATLQAATDFAARYPEVMHVWRAKVTRLAIEDATRHWVLRP